MEYLVIQNAPDTDANIELISNDKVIDESDSIKSAIDPLKDENLKIGGRDAENEGLDAEIKD